MPPVRVNFVESPIWSGASGATDASPAASVTAGNTLVVCIGGYATAGESVSGVTDTAGNTFTKVAHVFNPGDLYRQEIWVAANVAAHASNVVTATWTSAVAFRGVVVAQYSGLSAVAPLDDTEQYVGSAPLTTPTLTGTTAESVHILMARWGFGSTVFPAGFTEFTTGLFEVADKIVTGGAFTGTYTVTSANYFVIAAIFKDVGAPPDPTARVTQDVLEVLSSERPPARVTQDALEVLLGPSVPARLTQHVLEILASPAPEPGGPFPPGVNPPFAPIPLGEVLRVFFELKVGAESPIAYMASETTLSDPSTWYGGKKPGRLVSVSEVERELARDGEFRATEVRVVVGDTDRLYRTLANTATIAGSYAAVYIVADSVRYALGEPYRLFAGRVFDHRALPGFQYEFTIRDVLSDRIADLDAAPRVPPALITLADFPQLTPEMEGKAIPFVIGHASDADETGVPATAQGVIPAVYVGTINFAAIGGPPVTVDAYIWSQGALPDKGIWDVYFNLPDQPYTRYPVPPEVWGVIVWTPGKPGWPLALNYVDYNGRRYTPFFVDASFPLAAAARDGRIMVAANVYGLATNGDGTGGYISDPSRVWQWLIVNQLFTPYFSGDYAPIPELEGGGGYSIIDTDSVEAAVAAHHARLAGGYPVGFMLGRAGEQQTLRHVLTELCYGTDMDQGINRHGQLMVSVEDPNAPATVALSDLFDIEDGQFEVWTAREDYRNTIDHLYGFRYAAPGAPRPTPAEGDPLPVQPLPPYAEWTSGLHTNSHAAAVAANRGIGRSLTLENYVMRDSDAAGNLETFLLHRHAGPAPAYEGPRLFRLTTGWQGLGIGEAPVELGTVIAMTHLEGLGPSGFEGQKARVLKIRVDPQRARVTLEGRLLYPLP